jgi:DNA-binding MarR family transcriptional regulator
MELAKNMKKIQKKGDTEIQDVFMKFHQKFITCLRKEAENLNFTISQLDILRFIVEKKNPTMKDIASHLNITAPSATSMIENLYDRKLVNRKSDPKDRRGVRISPTQKTLKLFSMFKDIKAGVIGELFSSLTSEDKIQLTVILKKIV